MEREDVKTGAKVELLKTRPVTNAIAMQVECSQR